MITREYISFKIDINNISYVYIPLENASESRRT